MRRPQSTSAIKPKATIQGSERQSNAPSTASPWAKTPSDLIWLLQLVSLSIFKVCLLDSNSTQFCLHILLAAESRDSLKSNWMIHLWSVIGGGKWQAERSSIAERLKKEKPDISSKTQTPDLDLRPFICIQFTNLLCCCLQRQKSQIIYPHRHTLLTTLHLNGERSKRAGEVTFWNLFFST